MKNRKRKISDEKKVIILRELLENERSISELSEHYKINPNLIYRWKKQLFEKRPKYLGQNKTRKENEPIPK